MIDPGTGPTTEAAFKLIRKTVSLLHEKSDTGFNFVRLDLPTIRIMLMIDASFANASNTKSQLGFLVMVVGRKARRTWRTTRREDAVE